MIDNKNNVEPIDLMALSQVKMLTRGRREINSEKFSRCHLYITHFSLTNEPFQNMFPMSRDDVEMFEKRKKCRSSPYQQQPNIQYCLSWKAAETGTSPGSSYHFGMSRPHSVMLTSSKQIPLCHRNDSLNTTKSKLRSEASKNFMFSQRSLPGIDC